MLMECEGHFLRLKTFLTTMLDVPEKMREKQEGGWGKKKLSHINQIYFLPHF